MGRIYFRADDDPIDIRYDNVFKAAFARDTPESRTALSRLVSALIDKEVSIAGIIANEPPIESVTDRQLRFDINCKTADGELVNVEMSLNPLPFEPARLEFYSGKLFTGQDIRGKGKGYDKLKESYQISILSKGRFFADKSFFHRFEYYDPINKAPLKGKTRIITLELSKLDRVVRKSVAKMSLREFWAVFFGYLTDRSKRNKINMIAGQEEGIAMASEVLLTISRDEHERARLLSELKYELDMQSWQTVFTEQGFAQGIEQGIAQGEQRIIELLQSGKTLEEIIRDRNHNAIGIEEGK
jgi:predicted transposase/invertase (TIGR01784 family)